MRYQLILFHSIGDCSNSCLMRTLVAAELYLHADQYSNHPSIEEARLSDHMFTDHEDTIFSMILTESASTEFDRTRCKLSAIRLEALLTCDNFRWSSMLHVFAIATIMETPLYSVYPVVNEGIRPLYNKTIIPLNYSVVNHEPSFGVMWTRDGNLDSRQGICYEPNHFALMIKDPETTILSDVHSHRTFIPDQSLNLVDNDPTCDIQMDDGGNVGSTDVDMEVVSELGDNTKREPENTTTDTYVSDDYATEAAVQNIGTSITSFDLGDLIGNSHRMVTDYQKYQYLKHHFIPDSSYTGLLKQVVTKGKSKKQYTLSFQRSWLNQYPWLVYSPSKIGGLCKYCVLFTPDDGRLKNAVLVTRPFVNLTKATGKGGVFKNHESCQYHKDAMMLASGFMESVAKPTTMYKYSVQNIRNKKKEL